MLVKMETGASGGENIKEVTVTFNSVNGTKTIAVDGLNEIYAVIVEMNTNQIYGGGMDCNGTWQQIGYSGSAGIGVKSVSNNNFVWTDSTARNNLKAYVLGV